MVCVKIEEIKEKRQKSKNSIITAGDENRTVVWKQREKAFTSEGKGFNDCGGRGGERVPK